MQSRPFQTERKNERRPFKPKAWSHQDDLAGAVGKNIAVTFHDNETVRAKLIAADQFTLKLRVVFDQSNLTDGFSDVTIFKAALATYCIEPKG